MCKYRWLWFLVWLMPLYVLKAQLMPCGQPLELPNAGSIFRNEDIVIPLSKAGVLHVQKPAEKRPPYNWQLVIFDTLLQKRYAHYFSTEWQCELVAYSILTDGIYLALPVWDKPLVQMIFLSFTDDSARQFTIPFQLDFEIENMEANEHFIVFTGTHGQREMALYYQVSEGKSMVVPNFYSKRTNILAFFKQMGDIKLFWRTRDRQRSVIRGVSFEHTGSVEYIQLDDERGYRILNILRHDSVSVMGVFGNESTMGALGIFVRNEKQTTFHYFATQPGYLAQFNQRQKRKVKKRIGADGSGARSVFWYERFVTSQIHQPHYTLFVLEQYKAQQQTTPGYSGLFFPSLDQSELLRPLYYGYKLDVVLGASVDAQGQWLNLWSFDRQGVSVERPMPMMQILPGNGVTPWLLWLSEGEIWAAKPEKNASNLELKKFDLPEIVKGKYPDLKLDVAGLQAWYGNKILITGIIKGKKAKDGYEDFRLLVPLCVPQ